jgi:pimeloyl-ACP methyl ester carboxylesterase
MSWADINGARLFFTDEGTGPAVLLAHGTTCDSNDWNMQLAAFDQRFRVVATDLRGHGLSSAPEGSYSSRQDGADLATLATSLGITDAIVVGHSTGGQAAIALAVDHPQLVRAVIAVDPSYGVDPSGHDGMRQALDAQTDEDAHDFYRQTFADFYTESSPPHLRLWHARRLQGVAPWVLRACWRDRILADDQFFFRPETETMLRRVRCPVLTLRRASSGVMPESADWDRAMCSHPYSSAITWQGAGHWPHQERPDDFNTTVLNWIGGLPD